MIHHRIVSLLLFFLVLLDTFLAGICLLFPREWMLLMHGVAYDDPAGLVRRMGAVWLAFLILQAVAWFKWKEYPVLLVLVAGVRLTEMFSDWVYAYFAEQLSWFGLAGLLVACPANIFFGTYLIWFYYRYKYHANEQIPDTQGD